MVQLQVQIPGDISRCFPRTSVGGLACAAVPGCNSGVPCPFLPIPFRDCWLIPILPKSSSVPNRPDLMGGSYVKPPLTANFPTLLGVLRRLSHSLTSKPTSVYDWNIIVYFYDILLTFKTGTFPLTITTYVSSWLGPLTSLFLSNCYFGIALLYSPFLSVLHYITICLFLLRYN